jgi:hypothetical protein
MRRDKMLAIPGVSIILNLPERRVCGCSLRLKNESQPTT